MLVITLQFSYTQETINNALMKTAMFKRRKKRKMTKKNHTATQLRYWLLCRDQYTTLPCKLNREKPVTLTLPYSALSMCFYDLSVCHFAFSSYTALLRGKKRRKETITRQCITICQFLWKEEEKEFSRVAFLYTWRCLSCNCIRYIVTGNLQTRTHTHKIKSKEMFKFKLRPMESWDTGRARCCAS